MKVMTIMMSLIRVKTTKKHSNFMIYKLYSTLSYYILKLVSFKAKF